MTFAEIADRTDQIVGRPAAFAVFNIIVAVAMVGLGEDLANIGISIFTADLVLLAAGANRRANKATHAKLDELIHAVGGARDDLEHVEELEEDKIDELRR